MKSKIEKLERIPDDKRYYDESDFVKEVIEKINMIIDYLNSQSQPEEKTFPIDNTGGTMFPVEGEIKSMSKKEWKEFCEEMEGQDTPEEWICPKCGFDDCYPYKNSEDFGLMYCPACSELVKLNSKKK